MRTGSTDSDLLMLVVPIAVSLGFIVYFAGGMNGLLNLIDLEVHRIADSVLLWVRSL